MLLNPRLCKGRPWGYRLIYYLVLKVTRLDQLYNFLIKSQFCTLLPLFNVSTVSGSDDFLSDEFAAFLMAPIDVDFLIVPYIDIVWSSDFP